MMGIQQGQDASCHNADEQQFLAISQYNLCLPIKWKGFKIHICRNKLRIIILVRLLSYFKTQKIQVRILGWAKLDSKVGVDIKVTLQVYKIYLPNFGYQ